MGIFDKLFGRKSVPPPPAAHASLSELRNDPNLIQVFDKYGQEVFITKEQWRTSVLPGSIQSDWNDPDGLYSVIVNALNDGFRSDVVDAARQLYNIDPSPARGACVWAIVLMEEGRLDEAEQVLRDFISKHGADSAILTNLAKIFSNRGEDAQAEGILWQALELDPNFENGFAWYEFIHRERGGDEGSRAALDRLAALPGSWRAQIWLARSELQSQNLAAALALYRESLSRVPRPAPADMLMQISGDLGNTGHLPEILNLVEPHFDPPTHGLQVGNNLLKAHLDLDQVPAARRILDQLYALQRPDWKEHLSHWDSEIAKRKLSAATFDPQAKLQVAMLTIDGPVWLKPGSPAAELFPTKPNDAPRVSFMGSSAELATNPQHVHLQLADAPGRMSRALPLFLAEQIEFGTAARAQTLVPWIREAAGGFVLSGAAWSDSDAAAHCRQGESNSRHIVITHLETQTDPWTVELRLVRTLDGRSLGNISQSFAMADPAAAIQALAQQLLQLLEREAELPPQPTAPHYTLPAAAQFPLYLLRLEQMLAVRSAVMDGPHSNFLSGEREIIEGNLQQCLATPDSVNTRILLAQTFLTMKRIRPDILPEFRDRLTILQQEHPLPQPAQTIVQRMLDEALAESM